MPLPSHVPVLTRTIQILETISEHEPISAKALSIDLGVPPATCYRILNTLVEANWLRRDHAGQFSLSFGMARLCHLSTGMDRVIAQLKEPLAKLAKETRLSAKVSVMDGQDWLMIARHEATNDLAITLRIGARAPVYVGSAGAVLCDPLAPETLEALLTHPPRQSWMKFQPDEIRNRIAFYRQHGYAVDFGETNPSIHALSVPVDLAPLQTRGAITVFSLPEQFPPSRVAQLLPVLKVAVESIERLFSR